MSTERAGNFIDVLGPVKPRVRALEAYALSPDRGAVKINQNENPWDMPARIKAEVEKRMAGRRWSRYPDFIPASLHEKLADFNNWRADGVLAGNGSNELIQALLMVTVGKEAKVLISEPTFALYRQITTVLEGEIISVPLTPAFEFDLELMGAAIREHQPAVTVICAPNNPTGNSITEKQLALLLESARGLIAVDEAYVEFAGETVAGLLDRFDNLVVFRTFSKAMAMAALRVGYLMAAPAVAREISKAVLPYNLNAFSQTAAEVAIELYDAELRPLVSQVVSERERLFVELSRIEGLHPIKSNANFMVVKTEKPPRLVFEQLLDRDILIRDVSSYPMLSEFLRVSVGTPDENDRLVAGLSAIFQ
jgi:histidinol-phosphate aminotransferase